MKKRVFLIVLDSFGIGEMPDAARWNDEGSNTLGAVRNHPAFACPTMERLGLFHIDGVTDPADLTAKPAPIAAYARMTEASGGKDTTIGHWEISGIVSPEPMPTYPEGVPAEVLEEFTRCTGYGVLCNKPYWTNWDWSGLTVRFSVPSSSGLTEGRWALIPLPHPSVRNVLPLKIRRNRT